MFSYYILVANFVLLKCFAVADRVIILVLYDGEWKCIEKKNSWSFSAKESLAIQVSKDISYSALLEQLYEEIGVERSKVDMQLKVLYQFGGGGGLPIPPTKITNDTSLHVWLDEITSSIQHRTPLCVSFIPKESTFNPNTVQNVNVDEYNENPSFVPETGYRRSQVNENVERRTEIGETQPYTEHPEVNLNDLGNEHFVDWGLDNVSPDDGRSDDETDIDPVEPEIREQGSHEDKSKTPGSESSRVLKGKIIQDNMWRCPTFSDKNVPQSSSQMDLIEYNLTESSGVSQGTVKLGQMFENKLDLKTKLHLYAMKNNFEFKVKKSGTKEWYISCIDDKCSWRLRARKLEKSEMFEIRRFVDAHSCSLEIRHKDNRQAAPWVIGHCIKRKYTSHEPNYLPRSIISDFVRDYGINMSYEKAWRCREKALSYIRGTPAASYQKLPSYLYMLREKNPGSITDLVLDEGGRFKYFFMALGASIRGFRAACRPIICIDGSFLKTKNKGTMLGAIAQDANKQLYPVAFGVVDIENNDSWMYFMLKLRECIGHVENLVFVSDRHQSIASALSAVFPEAHHGACIQHIAMNIVAKFHTNHCHEEYFLAAKAYRRSEFHYHFDKIKVKDLPIAEYLEKIGVERWSRAYFPGARYNIMTSNVAESFNSKTRDARKWPITTVAEFLRYTIQSWFYERRMEAEKSTIPIAKKMEEDLQKLSKIAQTLIVQPLSQFEFYVMDGDRDGEVNLQAKTCSCGKFQLIGLPCEHALAACKNRNINPYTLCCKYYSNEAWLNCYAETIYPVGNEEDWEIPDAIKTIVVTPPSEKKMPGRPTTERRLSQGEKKKVPRRCSSCGGTGHNRSTCRHAMPTQSTMNRESTSNK